MYWLSYWHTSSNKGMRGFMSNTLFCLVGAAWQLHSLEE